MITLLKKVAARLIGAEIHASKNAIKGRKSSGSEDSSAYKHWKQGNDVS